MSRAGRFAPGLLAFVLLLVLSAPSGAQTNPYAATPHWGELPDGRTWGATSAIFPSPDGNSIWVAERCGQNTCDGADDVDPILQFDLDGNLLQSFGAGLVLWPHGMFVDHEGNVWVADAVGFAEPPPGRGHEVLKFSPDGELLMTLGQKGIAGSGEDTFTKPADVVVAPNGDIFVADGHDDDLNNRIVKFSADGTFIKAWGTTGSEEGEFREPHGMAMDSQGRLFVADRYNSRIQIFDQDGNHLSTWTQFGRPSGLFIDANDVLYAADSESNYGRNPGWQRGIYIGSAKTGWVSHFVPDPEPDPDNSGTSGAEGVAVDAQGNVYGAEVGPRMVKKYILRLPEGD